MPSPVRNSKEQARRCAPAITPEEREDQLVALAMDVIEEQLRARTISAQVLAQLARAGSTKDRLELEKLKKENELLRAKTESLQSMKRTEDVYAKVISALRAYSGDSSSGGDDDEDY